jgi:hypothetical protein
MSLCTQCQKPLTLEVDLDSEDEDVQMSGSSAPTNINTVPDDIELSCGHHFHWQCLLDAYDMSRCPRCNTDITDSSSHSDSSAGNPQILVNMNNEGGLQRDIDIFPLLQEESYLRAYPEERKARAFMEFCREGDYHAIVGLLKSCPGSESEEEDEEEEEVASIDDDELANPAPASSLTTAQILRYQSPLDYMQSGLHAAVANGHREVAYLLLLLASEMPELEFPALVYQEAAAVGVMREDQTGLVDIRSLRDAVGRTAEDVAKEGEGMVWHGWVGKGWLAMPQ